MTPRRTDIAIVGMAGRFPGAADVETYWNNIANRVESIVRYTAEDLTGCGVDPALLATPDYVPAGAPLADAECFDAAFFGVKGVTIPVAVSVFPDEIYTPPRSWAEKAYPGLIHYNRLDRGGHFAAFEQPELMSNELRTAFRALR